MRLKQWHLEIKATQRGLDSYGRGRKMVEIMRTADSSGVALPAPTRDCDEA
jgi:hypothetical protein